MLTVRCFTKWALKSFNVQNYVWGNHSSFGRTSQQQRKGDHGFICCLYSQLYIIIAFITKMIKSFRHNDFKKVIFFKEKFDFELCCKIWLSYSLPSVSPYHWLLLSCSLWFSYLQFKMSAITIIKKIVWKS